MKRKRIYKQHTSWAVAEREYLRAEVVLLQLTTFAQIPGSHRVVQATCPKPAAVRTDVDTGGAIGVALELAHQDLVVQVPNSDVAIAAAREADLRVGADS